MKFCKNLLIFQPVNSASYKYINLAYRNNKKYKNRNENTINEKFKR